MFNPQTKHFKLASACSKKYRKLYDQLLDSAIVVIFSRPILAALQYKDIRAGWKVYRNKHLNIYTDPLSLKAPAWGVGSETMKVKDFVCHDCSHSLNPAGEDWHFSATGRTCHPWDRSLQQLVTTTFSAKLIPSCQVHPKIFKLRPRARKDESWCFNSSVIENRLTIGCKYVSGILYISCKPLLLRVYCIRVKYHDACGSIKSVRWLKDLIMIGLVCSCWNGFDSPILARNNDFQL